MSAAALGVRSSTIDSFCPVELTPPVVTGSRVIAGFDTVVSEAAGSGSKVIPCSIDSCAPASTTPSTPATTAGADAAPSTDCSTSGSTTIALASSPTNSTIFASSTISSFTGATTTLCRMAVARMRFLNELATFSEFANRDRIVDR